MCKGGSYIKEIKVIEKGDNWDGCVQKRHSVSRYEGLYPHPVPAHTAGVLPWEQRETVNTQSCGSANEKRQGLRTVIATNHIKSIKERILRQDFRNGDLTNNTTMVP